MSLRDVVGERGEPVELELACDIVDQKRGADFHDNAPEIRERGNLAGHSAIASLRSGRGRAIMHQGSHAALGGFFRGIELLESSSRAIARRTAGTPSPLAAETVQIFAASCALFAAPSRIA